jgi:hypothetical protein
MRKSTLEPAVPSRRLLLGAGLASLGLPLSGCANLSRLQAVPELDQRRSVIPGFDAIRYVLGFDEDLRAMARELSRSWQREREASHGGDELIDILALSGGGDDGAFGAGLLNGWTLAGNRPTFKLVTGVSTGALIAPFAFLGPAYDERLREFYTKSRPEDILKLRGIIDVVFGDAVADSAPLQARIQANVDQALLDAVAQEYRRGRLLWVATTNLDSRRTVVWDLTRIAATPHPEALPLFRSLMLASASIPGAFPPVMIDVQVEGRRYQEMHVDGGTTSQVFVYPLSLNLASLRREHGRRAAQQLYVIRNSRIDPDVTEVERNSVSIAGRAMSTLIRAQGLGDLYRIYLQAQRDGLGFYLATIPGEFMFPKKVEFDTAYMASLFQLGFEQARGGYRWQRVPPFYEPGYRYGPSDSPSSQ